MGIIFGKKKAVSRITDQDKAVLQLKQQRDKLKLYQRRIEKALESDRNLAKRLINEGKKERAKLLLRKKRFQEQLLQKTDGQLENLERLTQDIEFAQVELEVVAGLKTGNEALKKINEALNINDIEKILEETREGVDKQREIDELLHGVLTDEDEEAVQNEYDQLILANLPNVPSEDTTFIDNEPELPDIPSQSPETEKKSKTKVAVPLEG